MFRNMAEVRAANKKAGYHFFDRSTLRFFDSRIGRTVYGFRYFITSEQFHGSDGHSAPRAYTIREVKEDGDVDTVGGFNTWPSAQAARAEINRLRAEGN